MHTLSFIPLILSIVSVLGRSSALTVQFDTSEPSSISGRDALRNAHLRFGRRSSNPRSADATNATVVATPTEYDIFYLIPVSVGMPAMQYSMGLDTSSLDFSLYAPQLGRSGTTVTTSVNIGGIIVSRQVVKLNNDSSGNSNYVGMGYSGPSFYTNAFGSAPNAVFAANLNKGRPGTYDLGYVNSSTSLGTVTYVPVSTTSGFWQFSSNGYAIGSGSFVSVGIDAIVDTGTTLIYLPQSVTMAYYKQVNGASNSATYGGYVFPCSAKLPDLTIGISSYKAIVPGSYLNFGPVTAGSQTCFGAIQYSYGLPFSILGLYFIKSQYVVFKGIKTPSLGFAKKS